MLSTIKAKTQSVKVSELQGAALDFAVTKCLLEQGFNTWPVHCGGYIGNGRKVLTAPPYHTTVAKDRYYFFHPTDFSADWAKAGPIIERESISLVPEEGMESWIAACTFRQGVDWMSGQTPLIAAMRCYVASKLGDEVEIPDELCKD